ncbi:hypothetical protein Rt10032_c08g3433 [Rhodotorula toruloides]|uniref:GmrSD restriction endonucleases N-terminal domain-containing protein n=1 Tax=Rhodotorula toruloides TaxID=5286 RepID=A0A511KHR9_RHOTO|nr:hypothetical protein Rt10032_c08g3433 [Rhodotorula toruloides]
MDDVEIKSEASSSQPTPRHAHPHPAHPLFNEPALSHAPTPTYQHQPVASTSAQSYTPAMNGYAAGMYADEEDELDELRSATEDKDEDSSDEEALAEQPLRAVQAKKTEAVKGLYKGERVLPEEEFGSKTVREIYDMLKAGVINLSPDYQREAVWPETHSAGLIESLLRNMHVPELLFNIYTPLPSDKRYKLVHPEAQIDPENQAKLPAGWEGDSVSDEVESELDEDVAQRRKGKEVPRKVWNCADGKQRMTAIKNFIEGKFAALDEKKKRFTYSTMEHQARRVFDSKRMRYGFYRELSDAQEREIFKRVQLGKALDKGEIMNAITSPYALWIHQLRQKYFYVDDPQSFRPRVLGSKRGKVLTASYVMSRNLLLDFDSLAHEGEAKRTKNMQELPVPSERQTKAVERAIDRFKKLTLVKALPGEDAWPNRSTYQDLRDKNVPVPHRVWRLRASDVDVERIKAVSTIAFAPVEIHLLPAVVQKFVEDHDLSDGELLEVVHRLRIHVHETFPGEVKDNSKTYQLVKAWVKKFDISTLERWYNDDGSLRKSYDPSSAARRKTGVAAAAKPVADGTDADGSSAQGKGKKREIAVEDSGNDAEDNQEAPVEKKRQKKKTKKDKGKDKDKDKGDRVQRSTSGDPLPFSSTEASLQPGARPQSVIFGDTASSTNDSAANTPAFGRAGAGTPAQPPPPAAQPQATPALPAGLSAKQSKYAQIAGLPFGGVSGTPAPTAATSNGVRAPSAAPPARRQPPPPPAHLRQAAGKTFDEFGRPKWEDAAPPAAALPAEDEVMDELAWGAVDFEQEETQRFMREREALRAQQQQQQQAQPQRLYGNAAAPPTPLATTYSSYDISSQYSAFAHTTPAPIASTSALHNPEIKPDPEAVEQRETSAFYSLSAAAARADPDEARRDSEFFAILQGKRSSLKDTSMRPPAVPLSDRTRPTEHERGRSYARDDRRRDERRDDGRDERRDDRRDDRDLYRRDDRYGRDDGYWRDERESSYRREDSARWDHRDDSKYDRSSSRDSTAAVASRTRLPRPYTGNGSNGAAARQNSGDGHGGPTPSANGYPHLPSNGYDGSLSNGSDAPPSNGFHALPPASHAVSSVASAYGTRGASLPDQNALRPVERTTDPMRR